MEPVLCNRMAAVIGFSSLSNAFFFKQFDEFFFHSAVILSSIHCTPTRSELGLSFDEEFALRRI
jgi:hypothetical protein